MRENFSGKIFESYTQQRENQLLNICALLVFWFMRLYNNHFHKIIRLPLSAVSINNALRNKNCEWAFFW